MVDSNVEASIGMTRKWDARDAGRELAEDVNSKLDSDPRFVVLFSTIHYEKHGGFQEFLNGIYEVFKPDVQLIGATVPGFINNHGVYTRGATALGVSYENMDVFTSFGSHTKRNPQKAAQENCSKIRKQSTEARYNNKFLLNLVSGPIMPKIPGVGQKKIIKSDTLGKIAPKALGISQYFLEKGFGREDEIFEEMVKELPEYNMIIGTSVDDNRGLSNYLFYNNTIMPNSVISLGIYSDLNYGVLTTHGMKKTGKTFNITELSKDKHLIQEINGKPALPELNNILGWPEDFLSEKTMTNTILYYPISLRRKNREVPVVMPFILNDSIMCPCVIDHGESSILTLSGKDIIEAITKNLQTFNNIKPEFGFCSACVTILQTLGNNNYHIKEKLDEYFINKPYVLFFSAGEGTYTRSKDLIYANMSFNTAIFGKNFL
ncbi:MAG: FIST N-terminal domain-containing protein [Candidatus Thermoplasmatota archaeon]|nr:FIST N-terminal domain-containing protein [Candidatus Thermoplasmatota archaeon]